MKILLVQGANMSYLGKRSPEIYGTTTAAELDAMLQAHAASAAYELEIFYTHVEGEAIGRIYAAADGGIDAVVINPAGFLHAGYALRDCLKALRVPVVEVHVSNIDKRGLHSVTAEAAVGMVTGFGLRSYIMGLNVAVELATDAKRAAA
jgi:3-dehydroquinate dehydratase II